MKLLTFWNVVALGTAAIGASIIVDSLPQTKSAAYAQSQILNSVASLAQNAQANPNSPTPASISNLLRVGERSYEVAFDSSLSTNVLDSYTILKISHGRESLVSVVTTPSGTYSTDSFASKNVLYPGVSVSETKPDIDNNAALMVLDQGEFVNWIALFSTLSGS